MDNTDLLFDAIEHPENFSEDDLRSLLADPEIRERYELMCEMRASLRQPPHTELDEEWKAFMAADEIRSLQSARHHGQKDQLKSYRCILPKILLRNAAAVVTLAIMSLAAIATVIGVKLHEKEKEMASRPALINNITDIPIQTPDTSPRTKKEASVSLTAPILFENQTLEEIIDKIRQYYGLEASFKAADAKKLRLYFRWDPSLPIEEVIDLLNNFRQFSIYLSDKTLIIE